MIYSTHSTHTLYLNMVKTICSVIFSTTDYIIRAFSFPFDSFSRCCGFYDSLVGHKNAKEKLYTMYHVYGDHLTGSDNLIMQRRGFNAFY